MAPFGFLSYHLLVFQYVKELNLIRFKKVLEKSIIGVVFQFAVEVTHRFTTKISLFLRTNIKQKNPIGLIGFLREYLSFKLSQIKPNQKSIISATSTSVCQYIFHLFQRLLSFNFYYIFNFKSPFFLFRCFFGESLKKI